MSVGLNFPIDKEYEERGYKQGVISQSHVDHFLTLLKKAKVKPIAEDDHDPNYVSPALKNYETALNASHKLFVLDQELLKVTQAIAQELKEPLTACLGSPWRIINVLCWETFPEALDQGPNDWHKDGLPFAINKVMIYLTGASEEKGSTSLKLGEESYFRPVGPAGTWLLFKVSEILHKGEKPKSGSRIALELRVVPSFNYDFTPYCAGFNAHYPHHPWHQPERTLDKFSSGS